MACQKLWDYSVWGLLQNIADGIAKSLVMNCWDWMIGTSISQFLHILEIPYNLKLQINLLWLTTSTWRAELRGRGWGVATRLRELVVLEGDPSLISSTHTAHNCL